MDNDRTAAHLVDEPVDSIAMLRDLASSYARRIPVRTVAVVANAPLQPSSTRAELIDSCDVVFRVNGFRLDVAGEAAAVGVRADVVVFTRGVLATPWVFRDHRERLYLLNEPGRMHWEPEIIPDWWPPDLGQIPVPNREITVPLSAALGIDTTVDATWATTGTVAAFIARTLFPDADLHLAGYSFIDAPSQTSWQHAYGDPSPVGAEHLIAREAELLTSWLSSGSVTLHR